MKKAALFLIRLYRKCVSRTLPNVCRFYPSCSAYAEQAITKYGALKGTHLAIKRIGRCHPFSRGGFDPVR